MEMEAAERILTVLEVDSLEEAANKVESLVKHHDQVEAMFAQWDRNAEDADREREAKQADRDRG